MSTGYYCYNCMLLHRMALAIGNKDEAEYYMDRAEHIKEAFNEKFLDRERCCYAGGSQAANVFPLYP